MKRLCVVLFGVAALQTAPVLASDAGGFLSPLSFGEGARGLGMGRAQIAAAQDGASVFWNPACLADVAHGEFAASYEPLVGGGTDSGVILAWPDIALGTFSLGAVLTRAANLTGRDDVGAITSVFNTGASRYALAYAPPVFHGVSLGVTSYLDTYQFGSSSAFAFGGDLGIRWSVPYLDGLSVAAVDHDAGATRLRLGASGDRAPSAIGMGVAYERGLFVKLRDHLVISADAISPQGSSPFLRAGAEYRFLDSLAVRAGWDRISPTAGLGASYGPITLDLAAASTDLGYTLRATLGAVFGPSREEALAQWKTSEQERLAREQAERNKIIEERVKTRLAEELDKQRAAAANDLVKTGAEQMHAGRFEEAIQSFERALAWEPRSVAAQRNRQEATIALRNKQASERAKDVALHLEQGRTSRKAGRYADAVGEFGTARALDPGNATIVQELTAATDAWQKSLAEGTGAGTTSGNDPDLSAALTLYANGKYTEARARVSHYLTRHPDDATGLSLRARIDQAIASGSPTAGPAAGNRERANKLYLEGVGLYGERKIKEAAEKFRAAVATDPSFTDAVEALHRTESILRSLDNSHPATN